MSGRNRLAGMAWVLAELGRRPNTQLGEADDRLIAHFFGAQPAAVNRLVDRPARDGSRVQALSLSQGLYQGVRSRYELRRSDDRCTAVWLAQRDRMTTNVPVKSRIAELSEGERQLWNAFKVAEKEYIPPALNPWKVSVNLYGLWRQGRLRFYEFYPVYGLFAVACAAAAIMGHWLLFAGYFAFLALSAFYLSKYVKQFAFQKTQIHGLARYSFGVPHLPLLVHGMTHVLVERPAGESASSSGPLTKDSLGSIIKLVKGGHEHGEIGYGFGDALKKWLYAAVVGAVSAAYAHAAEVTSGAAKAWTVVAGNWKMTFAVAAFIFGIGVMLHGLFFSPANEKRRKRRYLLALNTIYETWPGE